MSAFNIGDKPYITLYNTISEKWHISKVTIFFIDEDLSGPPIKIYANVAEAKNILDRDESVVKDSDGCHWVCEYMLSNDKTEVLKGELEVLEGHQSKDQKYYVERINNIKNFLKQISSCSCGGC